MKTTKTFSILITLIWAVSVSAINPEFTYQGNLLDGNEPANGKFDLKFYLYDAAENGNEIFLPNEFNLVDVIDGHFNLLLDYGFNAFDGNDRWLEVHVRKEGDNNFYILTPRQKIAATPYALLSDYALVADTATTAITAQNVDIPENSISMKETDFSSTYSPNVTKTAWLSKNQDNKLQHSSFTVPSSGVCIASFEVGISENGDGPVMYVDLYANNSKLTSYPLQLGNGTAIETYTRLHSVTGGESVQYECRFINVPADYDGSLGMCIVNRMCI